MALGQTYDNEKNDFRPTVYGLSLGNQGENAVDNTQLSFSMWKGTIKVQIAPYIKSGGDEFAKADRDNASAIYLNPPKAHMLADLIRNFMKDPKTYNGWSVFVGGGLISISDGKDVGGNGPCIILRTINADTGKVESEYAYQFKRDYHTVIESYKPDSNDFTKNNQMYADLEINQVIDQLEDYYRSSNRAYAFSVADAMNYQISNLKSDINKIGDKLGVQMYGGKSKTHSRSFFERDTKTSEPVTHKTSTIEDIIGNDD